MHSSAPSRSSALLQLARALFHVIAVASVTVWGLVELAFPFPAIFLGAGLLVLSVVVWALVLSPRPVLRTEPFGRSLVELLLIAAAVAALLALGVFWVWPALYGLLAAVTGYVVSLQAQPAE